MDYYAEVKIKQNHISEAIERMWADIFYHPDGKTLSCIVGTIIGNDAHELFRRDDCKHKGIATSAMDGAWNKIKKKLEHSKQMKIDFNNY